MDHAALKAELLADPMGLGYAAHLATGNDTALAAMLGAKAFRGPVPIEEVAGYCCRNGITGGVMALIEVPLGGELSPGVTMTVPLKAMLHTVLTLIQLDYRLTTCDTDDPAFGQACAGLQALGVMSADQAAALVALGDGRRSRAEVLFGEAAAADDVAKARLA